LNELITVLLFKTFKQKADQKSKEIKWRVFRQGIAGIPWEKGREIRFLPSGGFRYLL
jgi:hypothetical protein